jgi:hypothetical protein
LYCSSFYYSKTAKKLSVKKYVFSWESIPAKDLVPCKYCMILSAGIRVAEAATTGEAATTETANIVCCFTGTHGEHCSIEAGSSTTSPTGRIATLNAFHFVTG